MNRQIPFIFAVGISQAKQNSNAIGFSGRAREGEIMTKTPGSSKTDVGGRSPRGQRRFKYSTDDYEETPRSRRRYEEGKKTARGFAAMNSTQQRKIASLGGRSYHSRPRGFAAMSAARRRLIASQGGKAQHNRPRGFAAMNPKEQRKIAARGGRATRQGPRGFAAMKRSKQRAVAARGGRAGRN